MDELKASLKAAETRARSLKTKKAQQKAFAKCREIRREILDVLYETQRGYSTFSMKATVGYFGEGEENLLLKLEDGSTQWASPTSDAVSKSWYASTCCVSYERGQSVVVEFEVEVDQERLCLYRVAKRVHGGTLNETKYAELSKRTDLAFFKYPNCESVTGLFA